MAAPMDAPRTACASAAGELGMRNEHIIWVATISIRGNLRTLLNGGHFGADGNGAK